MSRRVLVTGATGFIGGRLATRLASSEWEIRCLVRDRSGSRASALEREGFDLHESDVLRPETLRGAGQGVDVAYYLIHSMGRGGPKDFAASERAAATAFARMARADGIERIIYRGGLGDRPQSQHLRSRHETALALREDGPPLTYFRAGMVVGPQSESYRTLRYLVQRLPAMIAPAWLKNATQPIAIDDTLSYLIEALTVEASAGKEIQIGGPDVLTYGEMLDRMAEVLDIRRRPTDPRAADHPLALITLDRPRHTGRRRRRQTIDRRTRRANGRHRPLRNGTVRHRADQLRSSTPPRGRRRPRTRGQVKVLKPRFVSRPAQVGLIVLRCPGQTGGSFAQRFQEVRKHEKLSSTVILSLTAKTALAWQGYAGALAGR
jgi:uncharacterized protein YbjT (DUF2867 family)